MKIKQKHYGNLSLDNSEKDIVSIWMEVRLDDEDQVIQVERENIEKLIENLKKCVDNFSKKLS